jgi:hypothetical protein
MRLRITITGMLALAEAYSTQGHVLNEGWCSDLMPLPECDE